MKESMIGIGEAAEISGLSIQQIRYMERLGLIDPIRLVFKARQDRLYSKADLALLKSTKACMDLHRCRISETPHFQNKEEQR